MLQDRPDRPEGQAILFPISSPAQLKHEYRACRTLRQALILLARVIDGVEQTEAGGVCKFCGRTHPARSCSRGGR